MLLISVSFYIITLFSVLVCEAGRCLYVCMSLITQIASKSLRSACVMDLSDASLTFNACAFNYATGSVSA